MAACFPVKLDDDRTLRGTDACGQTLTFEDFLHEGDMVGLGEIPEDCEDRDPRPPYGNVVRKDDGLWIVERTEEEEHERTQRAIEAAQGVTPDG